MVSPRKSRLFADQPVDGRGDVPLFPGCAYLLDGRVVRLLSVEPEFVTVEDGVTHEELEVGHGRLSIPPAQPRRYRRTDDASKKEFKRAEDLRDRIQQAFALPVQERTDDKLAEMGDDFGIGARRLRDLMTEWAKNPVLSTLIRQRRGPKFGTKRCSPQVEEILTQVVEWARKAKEAITCEACRRQFNKLAKPFIKKLNKDIPAPTDKVFRDRLARSGIFLSQRHRHGPAKAKELENPHTGTYQVEGALHRIEVDHTRVDLMVWDDEKGVRLGRPWLTLVIDCFTRIILGWYVSFDPPSIESVAQALICAATPKHERLKELGIGHLEMPYWGRAILIVTDNAREFKCEVTRRGCSENNMKITFRPLGKKYWGGRIERVIGTMMGKCHLLVGTTFNNPKLRHDYGSEARAIMTLREFEGWLVAQIHAYHHTPHGTLERTPHQEWIHAFTTAEGKYVPPAFVADVERFRFHFLRRMSKPLQQRGFRWDKRWYRSEVLFNLFRTGQKVWVYVDYVHPNVLLVQDANKVIHYISTKDPDSLSYSARGARRRALRRQGRSPQERHERNLGLDTADRIHENAQKRGRQRRRVANRPPESPPKVDQRAAMAKGDAQFRIPRVKY